MTCLLLVLLATLALTAAKPQLNGTSRVINVLPTYVDYDNNLDQGRLVTPQAVAHTGEYPWMVHLKITLQDASIIDCGGTLITKGVVLTAAQCVTQYISLIVTAGTLDPTSLGDNGQEIGGSAVVHPGFRRRSLVHDIAFVRLFIPFKITGFVAPVKILKFPSNMDQNSVRVLGWGPEDATTAIGTALNFADMTVIGKKDCNDLMLEISFQYSSTHTCLDTENKIKGFCYGDTGGPVLFKFRGDSSYTMVGIMSDFPSCPSAYPDAYTSVQPYYQWIKSNVPKGLL